MWQSEGILKKKNFFSDISISFQYSIHSSIPSNCYLLTCQFNRAWLVTIQLNLIIYYFAYAIATRWITGMAQKSLTKVRQTINIKHRYRKNNGTYLKITIGTQLSSSAHSRNLANDIRGGEWLASGIRMPISCFP